MLNINSKKLYLIYFIITMSIVAMFNISPIPQDPSYHNFADQRQILGISNFWNVVSNLPFIIISYIAVISLLKKRIFKFSTPLFLCYLIFYLAIGAVGLGSAYYHLNPSNSTLFWDRLPMTVGFMAFIAIITGEFISEKAALQLLFPLIFIGVTSIIFWHLTEQAGHGDLRFYGFVQFVPIIVIPMILIMYNSRFTLSRFFWAILATYLMAKIFEIFDLPIYYMIGLSGHTIKHFFAAIGPYIFLLVMKKRILIPK